MPIFLLRTRIYSFSKIIKTLKIGLKLQWISQCAATRIFQNSIQKWNWMRTGSFQIEFPLLHRIHTHFWRRAKCTAKFFPLASIKLTFEVELMVESCVKYGIFRLFPGELYCKASILKHILYCFVSRIIRGDAEGYYCCILYSITPHLTIQ